MRGQPAAVAPQTKLNLEFQGVLAASNPEMARAIIAVGSKEGRLYGVGAEIEGTNASIKTIEGNIVIDDSIFDQGYQAPGWPWDDSKFCYAAPTSAIVINKNCFHLNLSPGTAKNDLSRLSNSSKYFVTILAIKL